MKQVLAVVVRYNTPLDESDTIRSLSAAFAERPELLSQLDVLIWDNSKDPVARIDLAYPAAYRHAEHNLGIAGAFNHAVEYAQQAGYTWIMALDQDTRLSADFLAAMLRAAAAQKDHARIAAVAGVVTVKGFIVSPRRQLFQRHRAYPAGESGVAGGEAFAINSGTIFRVAALLDIGGYSYDFWLDYSDLYVFHQLFLKGWKVWRAGDATMEHDMSIMDYDRLMTPGRYMNYTQAESAFLDLYRSSAENFVQIFRLLARALRQRRKYKNPEFSRIAWRQLVQRLTMRRTERLRLWAAAAEPRRRLAPQSRNAADGPRR